jgi:peroxiredoxin
MPATPQPSLAADFELTDTTGRTVRLSDYRGRQNVVLVFNRGFA